MSTFDEALTPRGLQREAKERVAKVLPPLSEALIEMCLNNPSEPLVYIAKFLINKHNQLNATNLEIPASWGHVGASNVDPGLRGTILSIMKAFTDVSLGVRTSQWVNEYEPPEDDTVNQFCFFFKPEVTAVASGVKVEALVQRILAELQSKDIEIGAIRVLGGPYLEEHDLISQHYGVINKISQQGLLACTQEARQKIREEYKGMPAIGAHELLAQNQELNAFQLRVFNDNIGTSKIGGGCYGMPLTVMGKEILVLNPFHPQQLVPFHSTENSIIVLECRTSNVHWKTLRHDICGSTNPFTAPDGSIRRILLDNQETWGLSQVSSSSNGVHMSAGPLEGLVELNRFMSDGEGKKLGYDQFSFGRLLQAKGAATSQINAWANNQEVDSLGEYSFDATEEMNAEEAADLLIEKSK